ncbi:putative bifunctional diguanylate cyclase/phosphodiesterase [Sulfurivermis fontis]|uniref:putative bifunctional diguanylate cyclase/phosphodiesterase n=1 Tax=Sulfurivermis fontis TaxID=1972068 RepID=UPI001559D0E1|nr:EAL domain-containing protein [Sulfurivermis fontis]
MKRTDSPQNPLRLCRLSSLRNRYLAATLLLTALFTASALLLQHYVTTVRSERTASIESRQQATQQSRLLREAMLDTERALIAYFWAPSPLQRQTVRGAMDVALERQHRLTDLPWVRQHAEPAALEAEMQTLRSRLDQLMTTREDSALPPPADIFAPFWQQLQVLDRRLEESASNEIAYILRASNHIIGSIWVLALATLLLMLLGFFLFQRYVLGPISIIARALRDEAHGKHDLILPLPATAETQHLVDAFKEMRRQVAERQAALEHQALHDALTGLPNRVLLQDRVQHAIQQQRRAGHGGLALLIMDLDGFKEINDTLGHPIGDGLLQQLADRLQREVRDSDTVARLGGDEFAVLLEQADETEARHMAGRILRLLDQPFEVAGQSLYVAGSIGLALYPQHAHTPQELSRRADVAMYVAKREKNGIAVYDPAQDHYTLQRLAQASDLRSAIGNEHLLLHFQPQIDLRSGLFSGVEALLRWQHPQLGYISPDDFIPVAEQTGLIRHLTYWVLDNALAHMAAWRHHGLPLGTIAVNLSAYNLQDAGLALEVARLIRKWGVQPWRLVLEITESSMMANPARALATLEKLNDIGVQIAIDDFGTGYSSLSYLKQLPVDKLKIDKSFVIHMNEDDSDAMIVRSTIDLAHNLGLEVVAEGVESAEALELLRILDCDAAQGYFISRPLAAAALEEWLASSDYCRGFQEAEGPDDAPEPDLPTTH